MKNIKIIALIIVVIFTAALFIPSLYKEIDVRRLKRMDAQNLLTECRHLIGEYGPTVKDRSFIAVPKGQMPAGIMKLNPKYVVIYQDHILICLHVIPRLYVMGFAEGVVQFGQFELADGLRYSSSPGQDWRESKHECRVPTTGHTVPLEATASGVQ